MGNDVYTLRITSVKLKSVVFIASKGEALVQIQVMMIKTLRIM